MIIDLRVSVICFLLFIIAVAIAYYLIKIIRKLQDEQNQIFIEIRDELKRQTKLLETLTNSPAQDPEQQQSSK